MDEITKATVAAIRRKIPNLGAAAPGPEYSYHSLPLCIIDAVFSIGVRYQNVQNAVESWCVAQTPRWQKYNIAEKARHTTTDLIRVTEGYEGVALAQRFSAAIGSALHLGVASSRRTPLCVLPKRSKKPESRISPISGMPLALNTHRELSAPFQGKEAASHSTIS